MAGGPIVRVMNVPSSDEKDALAGANSPSASNPVATMDDLTPENVGADYLHGVESSGTLSYDSATHVVSVATSLVYWYKGTKVTCGALTCDFDLTDDRDPESGATYVNNKLHFVYFKDTSGKLYWSQTAWNLTDYVPVCTVFDNGSAGAVVDERHGHRRDLEWHKNAHTTIGARISAADWAITAPSVGSPSTVDFSGGTIWDEDLASTYGQQTNCRVWYQTGASAWTFVDSNSVYPTNVGFVDSGAAYALRDATSGSCNIWVYAAPDISRPIWTVLETRNVNGTTGYATTAQARAINPPNLASIGVSPELKLLYRLIMTSANAFTESTDYRSSAALPAGGTASPPTAAAVTFVAAGNVAATNVQAAIEELDTEKAIAGLATASGLTTSVTAVVIGRKTASGGAVEELTIDTDLTSVSGSDDTVPSAKATKAYADLMLPLAGGTITGAIVQAENSGMKLDTVLSADEKWSGITAPGTLGYTATVGDLMYLNNESTTEGRWEAADANLSDGYDKLLGLCLTAGNDGDATTVLLYGTMASAAFPDLTSSVGSPVYMSETAGDIVTAQPTTTDVAIRVVGHVLDNTAIMFNPSPNYITHT